MEMGKKWSGQFLRISMIYWIIGD